MVSIGDNGAMGGNGLGKGHEQLLRELHEERAAALLRISQTLESLIDQLRASRERARSAPGPDREREMAAWRACAHVRSNTAGTWRYSAKRSACAGMKCSMSSTNCRHSIDHDTPRR